MDSHPIPKNLMDVEFKLFGSLTLKEFGSLAINFIVALVIYTLKLPVVIGYPLIAFFVILGLAFAFIRYQGQSFPTILVNFLYAIFMPQQRIWKKNPKVPKTFTQTFQTPKHIKHEKHDRIDVEEIILSRTPVARTEAKVSEYEEKIFNNFERYKKEGMTEKFLSKLDKKDDIVEVSPNKVIESDQSNSKIEAGIVIEKENKIIQESKQEPVKPTVIAEKEKVDNIPLKRMVNLVFGTVLDKDDNPLTNCNIIIKNEKHELLRQTKTMSEGHFNFASPIENGQYYVFTEGPRGTKFKPAEINLTGGMNLQLTIKEE